LRTICWSPTTHELGVVPLLPAGADVVRSHDCLSYTLHGGQAYAAVLGGRGGAVPAMLGGNSNRRMRPVATFR
jgi:hypothetical protein